MNLTNILKESKKAEKVPSVIAYNRIDGPGSSLDLREWQMSLWKADFDLKKLKQYLNNPNSDPKMYWSHNLPRTIGITIDAGTLIEAYPLDKGCIGVESVDFNFKYIEKKGKIPPKKEYWLLKVMESMGIEGVLFKLQNLRPELKSAGLGGSATVTTGVAILANELAGKILNEEQIIGLASLIEQDFGISITGTQEQSNVIFGGVTDYLWFPFGIPRKDGFYGSSIRTKLLEEKEYKELEDRIALYFVGERSSTDVNSEWRKKLQDEEGFALHSKKPSVAYKFRENIRTKNWQAIKYDILEYQKIRTELCHAYMNGAQKIEDICKNHEAVSFPLGAGGGGSVMIYSAYPPQLKTVQKEIEKLGKYLRIDYKILFKGHELKNMEFFNKIKRGNKIKNHIFHL